MATEGEEKCKTRVSKDPNFWITFELVAGYLLENVKMWCININQPCSRAGKKSEPYAPDISIRNYNEIWHSMISPVVTIIYYVLLKRKDCVLTFKNGEKNYLWYRTWNINICKIKTTKPCIIKIKNVAIYQLLAVHLFHYIIVPLLTIVPSFVSLLSWIIKEF